MTEERVIMTIFTGNNITELGNLGTLACNIKCKQRKLLKKKEPSLKGEQELFYMQVQQATERERQRNVAQTYKSKPRARNGN